MKYFIKEDRIIVLNKEDFCPKHILECGQIFRYKRTENGIYEVFSQNKKAIIKENENSYEIITKFVQYFRYFFDLDTDYSLIKNYLSNKSKVLNEAIKFGYGIRILNQSPLEMIISFIISANNNIKRIQSIIEKLCRKCGEKMNGYYGFPTLEKLQDLSLDELKNIGLGYRAKYIYNVIRQLKNVNLESLGDLQTSELEKYLKSLCGVGPKVADCIALFAFHRMDCFPVDTWIEKVYNCYFSRGETNRKKIRERLIGLFGSYSGYVQQYLFYYKREIDTGL